MQEVPARKVHLCSDVQCRGPEKPALLRRSVVGAYTRFGGHTMIMWHLAKFDAPARIWIAGEVTASQADAAEQDLSAKLSNAGYLLTNSSIGMSWAKRVQRQGGLFHLTAAQAREYLSRDSPRTTVLVDWKRKWEPAPPKYASAGAALTCDQVVDYVSELPYESPLVRNVSVAIAQHHDSRIGYSRLVFKEAMRGVPGVGKVYNHPGSADDFGHFVQTPLKMTKFVRQGSGQKVLRWGTGLRTQAPDVCRSWVGSSCERLRRQAR
jgi:hypothetical protein